MREEESVGDEMKSVCGVRGVRWSFKCSATSDRLLISLCIVCLLIAREHYSTHTHAHTHASLHPSLSASFSLYISICLSAYVCLHMSICVCVCVCVCVAGHTQRVSTLPAAPFLCVPTRADPAYIRASSVHGRAVGAV